MEAACRNGYRGVALTDVNGFYGAVRFQKACRKGGLRGVLGTELLVEGERLVLLARSREGYAGLCRLLTELALDRENPGGASPDEISTRHCKRSEATSAGSGEGDTYLFSLLDRYKKDVICLAGARGGRIDRVLAQGDRFAARRDIGSLRDIYGEYLFFLLSHHAL